MARSLRGYTTKGSVRETRKTLGSVYGVSVEQVLLLPHCLDFWRCVRVGKVFKVKEKWGIPIREDAWLSMTTRNYTHFYVESLWVIVGKCRLRFVDVGMLLEAR
jgi:hypothetical protein